MNLGQKLQICSIILVNSWPETRDVENQLNLIGLDDKQIAIQLE